jgi:hypothetical protein
VIGEPISNKERRHFMFLEVIIGPISLTPTFFFGESPSIFGRSLIELRYF